MLARGNLLTLSDGMEVVPIDRDAACGDGACCRRAVDFACRNRCRAGACSQRPVSRGLYGYVCGDPLLHGWDAL